MIRQSVRPRDLRHKACAKKRARGVDSATGTGASYGCLHHRTCMYVLVCIGQAIKTNTFMPYWACIVSVLKVCIVSVFNF